MAPTTAHTSEQSAKNVRTIVADSDVQKVLDALDDADCRAILDATSHESLTANEISEALDVPLSTTYRKLDLLAESRLIEERTRIRSSGKHASEYRRSIADVVISLDRHGETEMQLVPRKISGHNESAISMLGN